MKNIVITGGSDGLGKTLAEYLSKENKIIILALNEEKLKQVASKPNIDYLVCDVSNSKQVSLCINEIIKKYKKIDVLINNAGLQIQGPLDQCDFERIKQVINVNLIGVINVTRAVLPNMKKHGGGNIINVNSQAGLYSKAERTVYHSSKWGVTGFSRCLQAEVAKNNIKVTDLLPGKMKTNTFANMGIKKDMSDAIDTLSVAKAVEFILSLPDEVHIPELGIKHILN